MRLFIAINFNNDTRSKLLALRDELRCRSERGNFSAPDNLHLTLAFLGECDSRQTAAAEAAMSAVNFAPFNISIERIGRFKRNRGRSAYGGDIWWAGVNADKTLIDLQGDLTDKLTEAGFTLDRRKFSPHITLGREVVTGAAPWQFTPFGEPAKSVELMKSERVNGKLTYTAISKKEALF